MKRPIVLYGHPVLRKQTQPIAPDYPNLDELIADMYDTMDHADGVGLAAPQIGLDVRLFTIDSTLMCQDANDGKRMVFINPQIISEEGDYWDYEEGCLSIPQIHAKVSRKERITLTYMDQQWTEHTTTFDGMTARVIQHEYDHIEGKLFLDHISPMKKNRLKKKLQKILDKKISVNYKTI